MWLDVVGLVILSLFAVAGAIRGTLATTGAIVSLLGAYGAAFWLAPSLGEPVAASLGLPTLLGIPAAGGMVFIATYVLLGATSFTLGVMEKRWRGDYPRTAADRLGGASVGLVRGGLIVLLIGWLALWLDGLRVAGGMDLLPRPGPSAVASATRGVVETGGGLVLGNDTAEGRVATRFMARPAESVESLQGLIDNPRIAELQRDDLFWSYVAFGESDVALNRASFLGIAYDETLRGEFAQLGLVRPVDAGDPRLFAAAVKEVLDELGPRIQALMRDPEVHALLQDPEVRGALERGDTLTLLKHKGFQQLVARVTSGSSGGE